MRIDLNVDSGKERKREMLKKSANGKPISSKDYLSRIDAMNLPKCFSSRFKELVNKTPSMALHRILENADSYLKKFEREYSLENASPTPPDPNPDQS